MKIPLAANGLSGLNLYWILDYFVKNASSAI